MNVFSVAFDFVVLHALLESGMHVHVFDSQSHVTGQPGLVPSSSQVESQAEHIPVEELEYGYGNDEAVLKLHVHYQVWKPEQVDDSSVGPDPAEAAGSSPH